MAELHTKVDSIGKEVSLISTALRGLLEDGRVSTDRQIKTLGTRVVKNFLGDILSRLDRVNADLVDVGKLTSHTSPPPPPVHGPDTPVSFNSPVAHPALPPNKPQPSERSLDVAQHQNQQPEHQLAEQYPLEPPHQPQQHSEHNSRGQPNQVTNNVDLASPTQSNHDVETPVIAPQIPTAEAQVSQPDLTINNTAVSENDVSAEASAGPAAPETRNTAREFSSVPLPSAPLVNQAAAQSVPLVLPPITLSNGSTYLGPVTQDHAAPMFDCTYQDVHKLNEELFERFSSHPTVKERGYFKLQVRDLPPLAVHQVTRPGKYHATSFRYQVDRHGLVKVDTGRRMRFKAPHLPFPPSQKKNWTLDEQKELWNSSAAEPPNGSRPYIIGNPLFEDIDLHPGEKLKRRGRTVLEGINTQYVYFNLTGKTITTMHREDAHVRSENLLRSGEHKFWCFIKPAFAAKLEESLQREYPEMRRCSQAVRHLSRHIPPSVLEKWGIEYTLDYCSPGQAVVTEPGTYHQVLNLGPNYALAVNMEYESSPDDPPNYRFCDTHCPDKFAMKADDFRLYEDLYDEKWGDQRGKDISGVRSSMAVHSSMTASVRSSMAATPASSMVPPKRKRGRPPKIRPVPAPEVLGVSMENVPSEPVHLPESMSKLEAPSQSAPLAGAPSKPVSLPESLSQQALISAEKPASASELMQSVTPPPEQSTSATCPPLQSETVPFRALTSISRELETPSRLIEGPQNAPQLHQQREQDRSLPPTVAEATPVRPAIATPAPTVVSETRPASSLPAFLQRPALYTPIPERPEPFSSSALSSIRGLAPPLNFLPSPSLYFQSPARSEKHSPPLPTFHNNHSSSDLSAPSDPLAPPVPSVPSVPFVPPAAPAPSASSTSISTSRPVSAPFRKTARMLGNKRPPESSQPSSAPKRSRVSRNQPLVEPRFAPDPHMMETQPVKNVPTIDAKHPSEQLMEAPRHIERQPVLEPHFVLASPTSGSPSPEVQSNINPPSEEYSVTERHAGLARQGGLPRSVLQPPQMTLEYHPEVRQPFSQSFPQPANVNEDTCMAILPHPEARNIAQPSDFRPQAILEEPTKDTSVQLNELMPASAVSRFMSSPDQVCGKPAFDRLARLVEGWRVYCQSSHVELGGITLVNHVEKMPPDEFGLKSFLLRFCKMKLAEIFYQKVKIKDTPVTRSEQAMNSLLMELGWNESERHRLHDYLREGKCWITLTRNFEGLLPILPLASEAEALELSLFQDQVKVFQQQLMTEFVRKLCGVGKTFQDSIWNCLELPEFVFESAYKSWFTVQQAMPMLKTFTLLKETYYDDKGPYYWGNPPSKWKRSWAWPTNPVAVPDKIKWCDADACRRRAQCRCASRLIPEVPRISIDGPKGSGVRAIGVFEPGEILGELTGELVPAGMFAGLYEWTWEIRRPDIGDQVVAEIWPRERGNWVRLVHHRDDPTTEFRLKKLTGKWRTVLVAITRINDGDEITARYGAGYHRKQPHEVVEG